jgi:hypothetical protein
MPWVDALSQDARYAARSMGRAPVFAAVAVVTLALGIGANATVFTIANSIFFKGRPFVADSDRVVYVQSSRAASYPDFADWRLCAVIRRHECRDGARRCDRGR